MGERIGGGRKVDRGHKKKKEDRIEDNKKEEKGRIEDTGSTSRAL